RQQERARDRPEAGDSLPKHAALQPLIARPGPEPDLEERAGELITRKGPADLAAQRHLDARAVAIAPTESWWESPPTTARTRRSCSRRSARDVAGRASSVVIGQMPWTSAIAALRGHPHEASTVPIDGAPTTSDSEIHAGRRRAAAGHRIDAPARTA